MKNGFLIFISILLLFSSCGPGIGDVSEDLGNGYYYRAEGSTRWIMPDNIFKDGVYANVIDYSSNNNFIIVKQSPSKDINVLFTEILKSRYDLLLHEKDSMEQTKEVKNFLNSELWKDSIWHKKIANQVFENNVVKNSDSLNKIAKQIIQKDSFFKNMLSRKINYFIIDKKKQIVFGSFSINEYMLKRKELNIPESLIFEN
jgi:hypothetical protein